MKKVIISMACMVGMIAFSACSDNDEPNGGGQDAPIERKDISLSRAEAELVNGQSEFAYKLFAKALEASSGNQNVILAPYTLSSALSMVANAAEGQVADEIARAMGWKDASDVEAMNALYSRLTSELLKVDNKVTFTVSNSAWLHPDYDFASAFKNAVEKSYNAETFKADFNTQQGIDLFNQWCAKASNGLISNALEEPFDALAAIASVNYFNGKWSDPFDASLTHESVFNNADLSTSTVDMMEDVFGNSLYGGTNYWAVTQPYGNEAFRMVLILPSEGTSVSEVAAGLTPESLKASLSKIKGSVGLKMPKFKVEYSNDNMMDVLKLLDMPTAMDPKYSLLLKLATKDSEAVKRIGIGKVIHKVMVAVDEEGAKAAGVGILPGWSTSPGLPSKDIVFDRPFIFIIDEVSTGSVLFMGAVNAL